MKTIVAVGGVVLGLLAAGCGPGGGAKQTAAAGATKSTTTATTSSPAPTSAPGAINVLIPHTLPTTPAAIAPATSASSAPTTSTVAATTTPAASTTTPAATTTPSATTPASSGTGTTTAATTTPPVTAGAIAAIFTGAAIRGTIPSGLTTGFDGQLYFVGERLVPGSVFLVTVNGVPTKFLPATFYSSELLSTYVYLTVPADYEFAAVAPDGSRSVPARFTVTAGTPQTLFGLNPPDVQMVFPTSFDASFNGVVWLMGDQFVPGAVATISQPGMPTYVMPLLVTNERTAGLTIPALVAGSVTITVTNPTLLSASPVTLPVGPAPAVATAPIATFPAGVQAPFLGTVHVLGQGIALGAAIEMRPAGSTAVTSTTVLARTSAAEALWTLVYPVAGSYEVRVVNPGGVASAWRPFDVTP